MIWTNCNCCDKMNINKVPYTTYLVRFQLHNRQVFFFVFHRPISTDTFKLHIVILHQCIDWAAVNKMFMWLWVAGSHDTFITWQTFVWLLAFVAVHRMFMSLQVAGLAETSVTQYTTVWLLSCVDSYVILQMYRLTKCLVTHVTFVWLLFNLNSAVQSSIAILLQFISCAVAHLMFMLLQLAECGANFVPCGTFVRFLSTMSSAVLNKLTCCCESFATNSTLKRFQSKMTFRVFRQICVTWATSAAFCALVFTSMNIHMTTEGMPTWVTFLTLGAWIALFSSVLFMVNFQGIFHSTHRWPRFLMILMLIVITAIIVSLYFNWTFNCTISQHMRVLSRWHTVQKIGADFRRRLSAPKSGLCVMGFRTKHVSGAEWRGPKIGWAGAEWWAGVKNSAKWSRKWERSGERGLQK